MPKHLGPIDITCDCPPYPIVEACSLVGILNPEDVRWCRMSAFLAERNSWPDFLHPGSWKLWSRPGAAGEPTCSCGHPLPRLGKCTFTMNTGEEISYLIGQCGRCRTIFWEDV